MNENTERPRTPSETIARQLAVVRNVDRDRLADNQDQWRWYEENLLLMLRAEGHDQSNVIEMMLRLTHQNVALNKQLYGDLVCVVENVHQLALALAGVCEHVGMEVRINGTDVTPGNGTTN